MKITHLNVRSITNKIELIENFLLSEKPDIFLVNEHGLDEESLNALCIRNYELLVGYGRTNKNLGGVAI